LALEGPIVKEKTTFSLSARRTYGDLLLQPVLSLLAETEGAKVRAGYYFYDFNGKITHKFSERSRLYASYYMGDDKVYARIRYDESYNGDIYRETMNMNMNWGNIVGSLRWNYVINPQLFMNITGSFTRYRNDIGMGLEYYGEYEAYEGVFRHEEESMEMTYKSGIRDYAVRADFDDGQYNGRDVPLVPNHRIRAEAGVWVMEDLEVKGGYRFVSSQRLMSDFANTHGKLGGYTVFDIGFVYSPSWAEEWKLTAVIDNLLDRNYCDFAGWSDWSGVYCYPACGRSFLITIEYEF
jgi:outer membrane cobalamin receptor